MHRLLDDPDWKEVFGYAGESLTSDADGHYQNCDRPQATPTPGHGGVSVEPFSRRDVAVITWISVGEKDGESWLVGGRLHDGRWFLIEAGCSYTGWDVQSDGTAYVATSRELIERYAMGDADRRRLGVTLKDACVHDWRDLASPLHQICVKCNATRNTAP